LHKYFDCVLQIATQSVSGTRTGASCGRRFADLAVLAAARNGLKGHLN
jgi:hypothetical protein